jgi:hypothetical protein
MPATDISTYYEIEVRKWHWAGVFGAAARQSVAEDPTDTLST